MCRFGARQIDYVRFVDVSLPENLFAIIDRFQFYTQKLIEMETEKKKTLFSDLRKIKIHCRFI
jgi:hypothetical protein